MLGSSPKTSNPAAYLQILCCTVPNVHGLEKRIITVVESTSISVEFVGENQLLRGAIVGFAGHRRLRRVRVDQALSQVGQERLALLALDAEWVVRARSDLLLCQLIDESTVKLLAIASDRGDELLGLQDRVTDEQEKQSKHHDPEATQVDHSSSCPDVAIAHVLLARLWVVQCVVSLDVLRE